MWISPLNIYKRYTTWFFKSVQKPFFAALVGFLTSGSVAAFVTKQLISYAISYVIQKAFAPDEPSQEQQSDPGIAARIQSDPSNKLPVVYGERQVAGSTTMADISSNNQKMAFIISLCEGPVESINKVVWQDKTLTFDGNISTGLRSVTNSTDGDGGTDDFLNDGRMKVRVYPNGGTCSHMSTFSSKWASKTRPMTNVAYAYVELTYDREKRVSGLPNQLFFNVKGRKVRAISNATTLATATYSTNPAECLLDYLTNDTYGCDISLNSIDLPSLYAHKTFCNELKSYTNESNVSVSAFRYTTNGVINTNSALDRNIKSLTIGNSAAFNWNLGKFGVITDKVKTSVKSFDTTNIYGGIDITGTGFDSKINKLTVRYDEKQNKGLQAQMIAEVPASNKNDNEPLLEQTISFPFTNNNIQAERAGYILLNQSRQALAASFTTDLSALEVQAGDVVDITHDVPGWSAKLFKVVSVTEIIDNGAIQLRLAVQEYAGSVYDDRSINEFDSAPNTNYPSPYRSPVITNFEANDAVDSAGNSLVLTWEDSLSGLNSSYTLGFRSKYGGTCRNSAGLNLINITSEAVCDLTATNNWVPAPLDYLSLSGGSRFLLTGLNPSTTYVTTLYATSILGAESVTYTSEATTGSGATQEPTPPGEFTYLTHQNQADLGVTCNNSSVHINDSEEGNMNILSMGAYPVLSEEGSCQGDIRITATTGNVTIGDIRTMAEQQYYDGESHTISFDAISAINVTAEEGNIVINGDIDTRGTDSVVLNTGRNAFTRVGNDAGTINITANRGNIIVKGDIITSGGGGGRAGFGGSGGNISFRADNGCVVIEGAIVADDRDGTSGSITTNQSIGNICTT